nr:MAG TPA: hypothetical protein [Caudoviricetes sp.]
MLSFLPLLLQVVQNADYHRDSVDNADYQNVGTIFHYFSPCCFPS